MMLLYREQLQASLSEFGILIPIYDSTVTETFRSLVKDPRLGPTREQWHLPDYPVDVTKEDLLRVHSSDYVGRLYSQGLEAELLKTFELLDFEGNYYRYDPSKAKYPLVELFDRLIDGVAGTCACCREALLSGFCYTFTGGFHHAKYDTGDGFCVINDLVIAARRMQAEGKAKNIWIVDVDAHKGDGTAPLCAGDQSIRTLSIHMADGWPLDRDPYLPDGTLHPSFVPSDVDIPIASGEEGEYVTRLDEGLRRMELFGIPDLAIVVGGADPYEKDGLPSTAPLNLTLKQLDERDHLVYRRLTELGIPQAWVKSGGYGPHAWEVFSQFLLWVLPERLGLS